MKIQRVSLRKLTGWKNGCMLLVFCALTAIASPAQTYNILAFLDAHDAGPLGLAQGLDGNFYGASETGGAEDDGALFWITPQGQVEYESLCNSSGCPSGAEPLTGLTLASDGNFYGTTATGTLFKRSRTGKLSTLYTFGGTDYPWLPDSPLTQGVDGNFYGTTLKGGDYCYSNSSERGCGTVFQVSRAGVETTLYSFCSQTNCPDGEFPSGQLTQAADGNFYGTTQAGGGASGAGTIFKITRAGKLTTLYQFCAQAGCTDGMTPLAGVMLAADGNLYGTTSQGGTSGDGTIFKITLARKLTTLYNFCAACSTGSEPQNPLIQATDGNFYGSTLEGGSSICYHGCSTIFEFAAGGVLTTLHNFDGSDDGQNPSGALLQATNGTIYGTTFTGGLSCVNVDPSCGTVFSLSVGLGPFVKTNPQAGKVGESVIILGTGLTGATGVSFNGIAAKFTVVSDAYIQATVPAGATTGYVTVSTPTDTLTSNVRFPALP